MDRRDRHGQEGPLSAADELARFRRGDIGFLVVIGILASIAAGWLHARGSGSGGTLEVLRGFVIAGLGAGVFAAVAGGSHRQSRARSSGVPFVAMSILAGAFVGLLALAGMLWD